MRQYLHVAPSFSCGRDSDVITVLVDQFRNRVGVKLIDHFSDVDFNHTVVEAIGEPGPLKAALLNMTAKAVDLINLEAHQSGSHPRIGAQDVIPIYPLKNITLDECKQFAEQIGQEIFDRLAVPVFFSGQNARTAQRKTIYYIRKGEYEGLKKVVHLPERAPDIGPPALHPTAGAVIVWTSDKTLTAFNVILGTNKLEVADKIAKAVRGPSGGFSTVRAKGLKYSERDRVGVSMNMYDYQQTPIFRVYEMVKSEAARYGIPVVGTELIGMVDQEALISSAEHFLQLEDFDRNQILENHISSLDEELE